MHHCCFARRTPCAARAAVAIACLLQANASDLLSSQQRSRLRSYFTYGREASEGRNLQGYTGWEPLRIHVHTEELAQQVPEASDFKYLSEELLQAAVRWLSLVLEVRPVVGNLRLEQHCSYLWNDGTCAKISPRFRQCGEATIPVEHFAEKTFCPSHVSSCKTSPGGDGIANADLALYVTAVDGAACSGETVAFASICQQDSKDRPVAGNFNFCRDKVMGSSRNNWHSDVAMSVHEILHILAFSSSLFAYFRDDAGRPRTPRDAQGHPPASMSGDVPYEPDKGTVIHTQFAGASKHYVTLPRVVEAARRYFACPTLTGLALEDWGGSGSAFSHWDERIMHTEIMTSHVSFYPRVSNMTLALLEDTGWYKPDYAYAGSFHFGKGNGCEFLEGQCVTNGKTLFPSEFCTDTEILACGYSVSATSCTAGRMGKALCTNCRHGQALPASYRYFADKRLGGTNPAMGFCPTWEPYLVGNGQFSFCNEGKLDQQAQAYGEVFGAASRCILSTVIAVQYVPPAQPLGTCREVRCLAASVRVRVGTDWVECQASQEGQRKKVRGDLSGEIICPSWTEICGPRGNSGPSENSVPCMFPGMLLDGRCVCAPGSINEDCSVRDTSANREQYPFGVRYMQDEIVLVEGEPLDQASGVYSWPLRPKATSGPAQLSYSVTPPFPKGLILKPSDGTISGTPATAMLRAPYTVRAVGGKGASTLTLFLTVLCAPDSPGCERHAPSPVPVDPGDKSYPNNTEGEPGSGAVSQTEAPGDEETWVPEGSAFLRLVLMGISFTSLQMNPGLGRFARSFETTVSTAMAAYVEVTTTFAFQNDHSAVDFRQAQRNMTLQQLSQSLSSALENHDSLLRLSEFGRQYLGSAELFLVDEGPRKIWPPPSPDEDGHLEFDITDWQSWVPYLAGTALVVSAVVACQTGRRRKGVNIHSKLGLFLVQLESFLLSVAFTQVCLMFVRKVSNGMLRDLNPADALYFSFEGWESAFLCATIIGCCCSVAFSYSPKQKWSLQAAMVLNVVATTFFILPTGVDVWPVVLEAFEHWMERLDEWQRYLLGGGLFFLVASLLCSCVGSCEDDQRKYEAAQQEEEEPLPSYCTVMADFAGVAELGAVVIVLVANALPEIEASLETGFQLENHSPIFWFALLMFVFYIPFVFSIINKHCIKRQQASSRRSSARQPSMAAAAAHGASPSAVDPVVLGVPVSGNTAQTVVQPRSQAALTRDTNEAMMKMLAMGFDFDDSLRALQKHNWDVARAVDEAKPDPQRVQRQESQSFMASQV